MLTQVHTAYLAKQELMSISLVWSTTTLSILVNDKTSIVEFLILCRTRDRIGTIQIQGSVRLQS